MAITDAMNRTVAVASAAEITIKKILLLQDMGQERTPQIPIWRNYAAVRMEDQDSFTTTSVEGGQIKITSRVNMEVEIE